MTRLRRTVVPPAGHWLRDAWVTGADAVIATALVVSGLFTHIRWLAALAGLWAVLALRQGYLTVRTRRSGRPVSGGRG
jgi:hypothetical protein